MTKKRNPKNLLPLLDDTVLKWHSRRHYDYQREITRAILGAVIEAQAATGATVEIPIELPRQSGKTTPVVDIVEFLLVTFRRYFGRPLSAGIFAPQIEQATTDFERLKNNFGEIAHFGFRTKQKTDEDIEMKGKWNSKAIKLFSQKGLRLGEVYIFPITKTSRPESKTLDVIFVEEAQDVDDDRMKNAIFPMGAATNAPRFYIGTAGTRLCYFKSQLDNNPQRIIFNLERVFADRRKLAKRTGDDSHLHYEKFINHEIQIHGRDSDYVQRQYFLEWKIGSGQFTTPEIIDALTGSHGIIGENKTEYDLDEKGEPKKSRKTGEPVIKHEARACFAGIDTAKAPDATVVTVVRDNDDENLVKLATEVKKKIRELLAKEEGTPPPKEGETEVKSGTVGELCNWLVLRGTNYEDQFDIIKDWLSHFENIRAVAIDATGQGDFMPDKFERHTSYNIIRVKFSAETKDVLYKNLEQVVKNALTLLPDAPLDSNYRQFRKEMIELQKEYKGRFLSCNHPEKDANGKPGHDDFCDSWALAEYAKTQVLKAEPGLRFL